MEITIPKTSTVMKALLRADFTTLFRNRRSVIMALVIPLIIVFSWKGLISKVGGPFILSSAITLGLVAIGLMGYTNSLARDREKAIFQRLRVAPVPSWAIMGSRLIVQISLITILIIAVFFAGYNFDHILLKPSQYIVSFLVSLVGGSVYLSLGQAIVGLIKNSETVNSTSRLIYFCFIMVGMVGELLLRDYKNLIKIIDWSPYGTVKTIIAAGMQPASWDMHATTALLATIGYTLVFSILGIKWFKWDTR